MSRKAYKYIFTASLVFFWSFWGSQPSLFAQGPSRACILTRSKSVSDFIHSYVDQRLKERFGQPCERVDKPIAEPLSLSNREGFWSKQKKEAIFAFWVDIDKQAGEALVRGIDLQSQLEWSVAKASVTVRKADQPDKELERSLANSIWRLVDSVIDDHPFDGIIDKDKFFIWSASDGGRLKLHRVQGSEKHPFLPIQLGLNTKEIPKVTLIASISEDGKRRFRFQPKTFKLPNSRVWVKKEDD